MKAIFSIIKSCRLAVSLCTLLIVGSAIMLQAQSPTMSKSFTINGVGMLDARTSGGSMSVAGTSGNEVEIDVYVRKDKRLLSASDPLVQELNDGYEVIMEQSGNTIRIRTERVNRSRNWNRMSISFDVRIPRQMETDIATSGGSIEVIGLDGAQQLKTSGGSIQIEDLTGPIDASTSGGSIRAENLDGETELRTSGGSIKLSQSQGDIVAATSGGSILLEDIDGTVDAKTSGGSIEINGNAAAIEARTSGGSINVDISGLSQRLSLATSGGSINAHIPGDMGMDLDLKAGKVNVNLRDFSGRVEKNEIVGSMNGGGIPIYMRASGGNVNCTFR